MRLSRVFINNEFNSHHQVSYMTAGPTGGKIMPSFVENDFAK